MTSYGCTVVAPAGFRLFSDINMSSIQPFQFEPERNINEEDRTGDVSQNKHENEEQVGQDGARAGQNRWLMCGKCVSMVTEKESACCTELPFLSAEVHGKISCDQIY